MALGEELDLSLMVYLGTGKEKKKEKKPASLVLGLLQKESKCICI